LWRLDRACDRFIEEEFDLLDRSANERALTAKIAEYLQEEFLEFNVDCRHGSTTNHIVIRGQAAAPSLLLLEATMASAITTDKKKIAAFEYGDGVPYEYGALLRFMLGAAPYIVIERSG
jgi:hypothetical protein